MLKKISSQDIKELRSKTGAGMTDCKKALEASEGQIDIAIENLSQTSKVAGPNLAVLIIVTIPSAANPLADLFLSLRGSRCREHIGQSFERQPRLYCRYERRRMCIVSLYRDIPIYRGILI